MLKRRSIDLHINHERWLVSYADFVTLLFAFFVVMYSVSQINESKYKELTSTLNGLFSEEQLINNNEDINTKQTMISSESLVELPALEDAFYQQLLPLIEQGAIVLSSNELWLQISLNNRILFEVGSVKPSVQANEVIAEIAFIMKDTVNPIRVEGFTDNLAINTAQFPSNWQLSTARASAIVQLLVANGVSPIQLSAVGYGEFHPVANNSSEAGRAQNRRVVLMIGKFKENRPEHNDLLQNKPTNTSNTAGSHKHASQLSRKTTNATGSSTNSSTKAITGKQTSNETQTISPEAIKPIVLDSGELLFTNDTAP